MASPDVTPSTHTCPRAGAQFLPPVGSARLGTGSRDLGLWAWEQGVLASVLPFYPPLQLWSGPPEQSFPSLEVWSLSGLMISQGRRRWCQSLLTVPLQAPDGAQLATAYILCLRGPSWGRR